MSFKLKENVFAIVDPKKIGVIEQNKFDEHGIRIDHVIDNFRVEANSELGFEFQRTMIKKGYLEAVCPFSGKLLKTNSSIVSKLFCFYKFKSNKCIFWIVCGVPSQRFAKQALILELPTRNLILLKRNTPDFYSIVKNVSIDFLNAFGGNQSKRRIRIFGGRKRAIVCHHHFFHLIWNELSGLEQLYKNNLLKNVDKIIVRKTILDLRYFFPNISRKFDYLSLSEIDKLGAQGKYFFIKVGKTMISEEFIEKTYQYACQNVSEKFLRKVEFFRKQYRCVVAISVRGQLTKVWLNQVEGVANIINELQMKYKNLGIVLDGFSITDDRNSALIVEKQQAIVSKILSRLNEAECVWNTVGCTMIESIVLSRMIDTYLCTQGSQQHKWGWFGNKPGVVHGPKQRMIESEQFKVTSPAYSIPKPIFCFNVSSEKIRDQAILNGDPAIINYGSHQDYDFDWRLAYEKVDLILSKLIDHKSMGSEEWNEMVKSYNGRISDD